MVRRTIPTLPPDYHKAPADQRACPIGARARLRRALDEPEAVGDALWALRQVQIGGSGTTARDLAVLGKALAHVDARVRDAAIDALHTGAAEARDGRARAARVLAEHLPALASDDAAFPRAIELVGVLGGAAHVDDVVAAIDDPRSSVRVGVARALCHARTAALHPHVARLAERAETLAERRGVLAAAAVCGDTDTIERVLDEVLRPHDPTGPEGSGMPHVVGALHPILSEDLIAAMLRFIDCDDCDEPDHAHDFSVLIPGAAGPARDASRWLVDTETERRLHAAIAIPDRAQLARMLHELTTQALSGDTPLVRQNATTARGLHALSRAVTERTAPYLDANEGIATECIVLDGLLFARAVRGLHPSFAPTTAAELRRVAPLDEFHTSLPALRALANFESDAWWDARRSSPVPAVNVKVRTVLAIRNPRQHFESLLVVIEYVPDAVATLVSVAALASDDVLPPLLEHYRGRAHRDCAEHLYAGLIGRGTLRARAIVEALFGDGEILTELTFLQLADLALATHSPMAAGILLDDVSGGSYDIEPDDPEALTALEMLEAVLVPGIDPEGFLRDAHEESRDQQRRSRRLHELINEPHHEPLRRDARRVGRNEPCPCGSGRKHKRCCGAPNQNDRSPTARRTP